MRIDAAQNVVFQTVFSRCRVLQQREKERGFRIVVRAPIVGLSSFASERKTRRRRKEPPPRESSSSSSSTRIIQTTQRREISPLRSPLKEERQRERARAKERKHDARKKHRTHVDVNSFASLRTGRSNTLKSKFKDVIDDDDAGRVCFFLPFKKGRKCDDSDGVKRDKKGL